MTELDGLRGIAASLVLLYHYTAPLGSDSQGSTVLTVPWGGLGVQLFFMISGFVILMTADRAKTVANFAVARASRLFPAYWFACGLALIMYRETAWPSYAHGFDTFLVNLTMMQGFFGIEHLVGVFWTLHVELSFYLLIGLLLAYGWCRHVVSILTVLILSWAIVAHAWHINEFAFDRTPAWLSGMRMAFPILFHHLHPMPFFLLGIVFYRTRDGYAIRDVAGGVVALADIALHSAAHRPHVEWVVLLLMIVAVWLATQRGSAVLRTRPLVLLGAVSYSLYLTHTLIGPAIIGPLDRDGLNPNAAATVAALAALLVATLCTFCLERPANGWLRHRYRQRRQDSVAYADRGPTVL